MALLKREMIDWKLAQKLTHVIREHTKGKLQPSGIGMATLSVMLANSFRANDNPGLWIYAADHVCDFIIDLTANGWTPQLDEQYDSHVTRYNAHKVIEALRTGASHAD
jgi:hypothetical protein